MTRKALHAAYRMEIKSRYRGCLIGALLGDSIGSAYENEGLVNIKKLHNHIRLLENGDKAHLELTDDTQMTQELADSLIQHHCFNAEDMARRFTLRFYKDGTNYYGENVRQVFSKLKETNFSDPLKPAREQFNGTGSFGNGAAMRISPVPLFCFPDLEATARLTEQTASITHTHPDAIQGALLIAIAIRTLLSGTFHDPFSLISNIREDFRILNVGEESDTFKKLTVVEELLKKPKVSDTEVEQKLGVSVAAIRSVPTALFCFLSMLNKKQEPLFRNTIEYAISLGGDTDTIASMAGSLAGAYVGIECINKNAWISCPGAEKAIAQADALYEIHSKRPRLNV